MNVLVTGKSGRLGQILFEECQGRHNKYIFTSSNDLNLMDRRAICTFLEKFSIQIVINCTAYTNVLKAESEYDRAYAINCFVVENLAAECKRHNVVLIHISTDYVFSSNVRLRPFKESDEPTPIGVYGKTKLIGEKIIEASGCDHIIIRTSWLYSEYYKSFLTNSYENVLTCKTVVASTNQVGSPTYIRDLARAIVLIIESDRYKSNLGLYHYSGNLDLSHYEVTQFIVKNYSFKCNVIPSTFNSISCVHPGFTSLDSSKFCLTFNVEIPNTEERMRYVIDKYIQGLSKKKKMVLLVKRIIHIFGLKKIKFV